MQCHNPDILGGSENVSSPVGIPLKRWCLSNKPRPAKAGESLERWLPEAQRVSVFAMWHKWWASLVLMSGNLDWLSTKAQTPPTCFSSWEIQPAKVCQGPVIGLKFQYLFGNWVQGCLKKGHLRDQAINWAPLKQMRAWGVASWCPRSVILVTWNKCWASSTLMSGSLDLLSTTAKTSPTWSTYLEIQPAEVSQGPVIGVESFASNCLCYLEVYHFCLLAISIQMLVSHLFHLWNILSKN